MAVRTAVAVAAFAAFGLLAVACSDSKSISADSTARSETTLVARETSTTDTTLAITTTTNATATTTVVAETTLAPDATVAATVAPPPPPAPTCAAATAPTGAAISLANTSGDWNGDGDLDTVVSWAEPVGDGLDWFVRTEIAGGAASSVALGDLGVGFAAVMDAVDVNFSLGAPEGTNREEVLAIVGVSSSGYNLGVFGVTDAGCAFQFDDGAGGAFLLPTAGTIGQLSGVRCDGGAGSQFLVKLEASSADEVSWNTTDYRIERQGVQSLILGAPIAGSLTAGDAALAQYGQATCGGVNYLDEFNDSGGDY